MSYAIETKCVQEGYTPKNGEPRVLPICQSTTFQYASAEQVGRLFDLSEAGHFYTRLSNPTLECVENKIAALEGGIGAMLTSSGQAALTFAFLNIASNGDHIIASSAIYGGTFNLLDVTLRRLGIETTFVDPDISYEELVKKIRPNTKLLFGETLANPALVVLDIEKFARAAHDNGLPLFVDNTFPTPVFCRPIEHGADIVLHSTSKYMDGHAVALGGVIVDSGKFDWDNGKFPGLSEPDQSYHGIVYTKDYGKAAFITKARVQLMRDMGSMMSPMNAFLLNLGLETLHLRMPRHAENALKVAEFLEGCAAVESVNFPQLKSNRYYHLAQKYMPQGTCGVISFNLKGGRDAAMKFMNRLSLAKIVVHVADVRTGVLHPASSTHRQLKDQQLIEAGITPGLVRISVGIENANDIIADLKQALAAIS
jgi:O-acetylhomoserine (thiol)-lyase